MVTPPDRADSPITQFLKVSGTSKYTHGAGSKTADDLGIGLDALSLSGKSRSKHLSDIAISHCEFNRFDEAYPYFKASYEADKKNPDASYGLMWYANRDKNHTMALYLMRRAANRGHREAIAALPNYENQCDKLYGSLPNYYKHGPRTSNSSETKYRLDQHPYFSPVALQWIDNRLKALTADATPADE
jgi:hypothetical protein